MKHVNVPNDWSPQTALAIADFLEKIAEAIWRAHGFEMSLLYGERNLPTPTRMRLDKLARRRWRRHDPNLPDDSDILF